jgi:hypothetical protein
MDLDLAGFLTEGVLAHVADEEVPRATQALAWRSWTWSTTGGRRPVAEAQVDSAGSTKKGRAHWERIVVVNKN